VRINYVKINKNNKIKKYYDNISYLHTEQRPTGVIATQPAVPCKLPVFQGLNRRATGNAGQMA
jgi:hypothetical protein